MKSWGITLSLLIVSVSAWGQRVDQFEFVSALYTPVALFDKIETVSKDVHTEFNEGTAFNIGSSGGTQGGSIHINGKPIRVETLVLEGRARLSFNAPDARWFVNTLEIGPDGVFGPQSVIVNRVSLVNTGNDTTLEVGNLHSGGFMPGGDSFLWINGDVWGETGWAQNVVETQNGFNFVYANHYGSLEAWPAPEHHATWQTGWGKPPANTAVIMRED